MNSGWRNLPSGLVKSNRHNCVLLTLIPLAGLIGPGIAPLPALPLWRQRGQLHSWSRAGEPRLRGGQGLWQPLAGRRRFPHAPPLCLQESAEKKPGDSQGAAGPAELNPGAGEQAAGNPVDPEPGQPLIPAGGTAEEPAGTAERSTWDVHHIIYYSMDCAKHCPYRVLAECSQPPWEGQWGRVVLS